MAKGIFPTLSENHRRSIRVTLVFLDEMLCDFEEIANGRERKSVLFVERNALSDEQRRAILEKIRKMRPMLRTLRADLGLGVETHDLLREVFWRTSMLWEHIVDTRSRGLKRYGALPEGLPEYLDPKIKEIIRDLNEMTNIVRTQKDGKPPSS